MIIAVISLQNMIVIIKKRLIKEVLSLKRMPNTIRTVEKKKRNWNNDN